MITPDPMMSDELFSDVLDYALDENSQINPNDLTVRLYDEVSKAVLTMVETYGGTPRWIIEEFIVDGEFPTDPNQPDVHDELTDLYHKRVDENGELK